MTETLLMTGPIISASSTASHAHCSSFEFINQVLLSLYPVIKVAYPTILNAVYFYSFSDMFEAMK